jgi:Putative beta-barrel porin-2, OmpL-like. bbp2
MTRLIISTLCILILPHMAAGSPDSLRKYIHFSGYADVYYSLDFAFPSGHKKPAFMYSYDRHNEVNLNLGFAKATFKTDRSRANLAFMAGTYAQTNLSSEPVALRNILEANVGFKLSKKKDIWVDAGVMPSHIGFESAVGLDCDNLSRSLIAENSPYYETGVKLTSTSAKGNWILAGFVLNGWQHIRRPAHQNLPAIGTQVQWKPNDKTLFNSSTFFGREAPDSVDQFRFFHNFYFQTLAGERWKFTAGVDVGVEQGELGSDIWYGMALTARYSLSERVALAVRGESYNDPSEFIISIPGSNWINAVGASANVDVKVSDAIVWRMEGRMIRNGTAVFTLNGNNSLYFYGLTTCLIAAF